MSDVADAVMALDADAFDRAADAIVTALDTGEGVRINFQPGDATKYIIVIGVRRTLTISDGESTTLRLAPIGDVEVAFGTDSMMSRLPFGHASRMEPRHPWTNEVWKRLWATVTEKLR